MSKQPLDDQKTGIHRAKLWEIALYAMNDASTNCYMLLVNSISYFLVGIVGVLAVVAGTLVTVMRIWDGCTDPFVGMVLDNTNTKFGKNRPFIVAGQVIMFVTTFAMFRFIPEIPSVARFIVWLIIYMIYIMNAFSNLSGSIVVPMTADCADYEVYRSKRYVPGLMGTLFSFVDKVISSLGETLVTLVYATIGYTDSLPTQSDPYSTKILVCTLICFLGFLVLGWILNLVAMKFYPLSKEKMAEIQDEIAAIKAQTAAQ